VKPRSTGRRKSALIVSRKPLSVFNTLPNDPRHEELFSTSHYSIRHTISSVRTSIVALKFLRTPTMVFILIRRMVDISV
jgi:hypothetical protein